MTLFFPSTFWALTICDIHSCEKCQNSFSCVPPFGPFLSVKYLKFGGEWDQNFVRFGSGNIHIKESNEPGFTFSIASRTKFVWSHGLKMSCFLLCKQQLSHIYSKYNLCKFHINLTKLKVQNGWLLTGVEKKTWWHEFEICHLQTILVFL